MPDGASFFQRLVSHDLADAGHRTDRRTAVVAFLVSRLEQRDRQQAIASHRVANQRLVARLEDVQRKRRMRHEHGVG